MNRTLNAAAITACLLALVSTRVLPQMEVPAVTNDADLHDPRNLPLTLNADIRIAGPPIGGCGKLTM